MFNEKENFTPVVLNGITGGRNVKKTDKYILKRKGVECYFQNDFFIIKGINYPVFFAVHKSKLKNMADIFYKADCLTKIEEKTLNEEWKFDI